MSMPFYVSPEQPMRDKADYARKGVARSRSSVVLQYSGGILLVTPNMSSVLHKISEIYDRIAFAAVGRYNEYEVLRKAGVTYADVTGYQFDRGDVTARGLANWYAQALGTNFSEPTGKPYEVEIVVAEVGLTAGRRPDLPHLLGRLGLRRARLRRLRRPGRPGGRGAQGALRRRHVAHRGPRRRPGGPRRPSAASARPRRRNGSQPELTAANLEVAILDRARAHRTFRRLQGPRLEELIAAVPRAPRDRETETPAEPSPPKSPRPPAGELHPEPPHGPARATGDGSPLYSATQPRPRCDSDTSPGPAMRDPTTR